VSRAIFLEPPRSDVDVSTVRKYGQIVYLFAPAKRGRGGAPEGSVTMRPNRPSTLHFEAYLSMTLESLENVGYDPMIDFIVITGQQLALCLTFAGLALRYGKFRCLVFSAHEDTYAEKEFDPRWVLEPKGDSKPCLSSKSSHPR
jgi:hypothetical protein